MLKKQGIRMAAVVMLLLLTASLLATTASADIYMVLSATYLKEHPYSSAADTVYVPANTTVSLCDSRDGWYQVGYQGRNGWIPASQVSVGTSSAIGTTAGWRIIGADTRTTDNLNLRVNPADTAEVLQVIPRGENVFLHSNGGDWAYVAYNGAYGYVMQRFLSYFEDNPTASTSTSAPSPSPTPTSTPVPVPNGSGWKKTDVDTTLTGDINMRTGPSTKYPLITVIPEGAAVHVSAVGKGWAAVEYNGMSGYCVNGYFARTGGASPSPSPSPTPSARTDGGGQPPTDGGWTTVNWKTTTKKKTNLRSGPGTEYTVYTEIPAGAQLSVVNYDSYRRGWTYVTYGSQYSGYVSTNYLNL